MSASRYRKSALRLLVTCLVVLSGAWWLNSPPSPSNDAQVTTRDLSSASTEAPEHLSFYNVPDFTGRISMAEQAAAIMSWHVQDLAGITEAGLLVAQEDPFGNILTDSLFALASNSSRDLAVLIQPGMIIRPDFLATIAHVRRELSGKAFLMAGAEYSPALRGSPQNPAVLAMQPRNVFVQAGWVLQNHGAPAYLVWPKDGLASLLSPGKMAIPPFSYSGPRWTQWLIAAAPASGVEVIDSTLSVLALLPAVSFVDKVEETSRQEGWEKIGEMETLFFGIQGNLSFNDGHLYQARWKVAMCRKNRKMVPCLQERVGMSCPCEHIAYWPTVAHSIQFEGSLKVCGIVHPLAVSENREISGTLMDYWDMV